MMNYNLNLNYFYIKNQLRKCEDAGRNRCKSLSGYCKIEENKFDKNDLFYEPTLDSCMTI